MCIMPFVYVHVRPTDVCVLVRCACRCVKHFVLAIRVGLKAGGAAAEGAVEDKVHENAAMLASLPQEIRDCFTDNFSPKQKKRRDDSGTEVWDFISGKDDDWAYHVFGQASFWDLGIIKPWPKKQRYSPSRCCPSPRSKPRSWQLFSALSPQTTSRWRHSAWRSRFARPRTSCSLRRPRHPSHFLEGRGSSTSRSWPTLALPA